jgi:predicted membrane-bound dolichyl-phosphate-mannose-protein mannosyltransferase
LNNLNQTQKKYLKKVTDIVLRKKIEEELIKVNSEIAGLTDNQIYCLDNTVYTDSARKKLIEIFRVENLFINLDESMN